MNKNNKSFEQKMMEVNQAKVLLNKNCLRRSMKLFSDRIVITCLFLEH